MLPVGPFIPAVLPSTERGLSPDCALDAERLRKRKPDGTKESTENTDEDRWNYTESKQSKIREDKDTENAKESYHNLSSPLGLYTGGSILLNSPFREPLYLLRGCMLLQRRIFSKGRRL